MNQEHHEDLPGWLDRSKTPEQRRDAWAQFVKRLEKHSTAPRSNLNDHYVKGPATR